MVNVLRVAEGVAVGATATAQINGFPTGLLFIKGIIITAEQPVTTPAIATLTGQDAIGTLHFNIDATTQFPLIVMFRDEKVLRVAPGANAVLTVPSLGTGVAVSAQLYCYVGGGYAVPSAGPQVFLPANIVLNHNFPVSPTEGTWNNAGWTGWTGDGYTTFPESQKDTTVNMGNGVTTSFKYAWLSLAPNTAAISGLTSVTIAAAPATVPSGTVMSYTDASVSLVTTAITNTGATSMAINAAPSAMVAGQQLSGGGNTVTLSANLAKGATTASINALTGAAIASGSTMFYGGGGSQTVTLAAQVNAGATTATFTAGAPADMQTAGFTTLVNTTPNINLHLDQNPNGPGNSTGYDELWIRYYFVGSVPLLGGGGQKLLRLHGPGFNNLLGTQVTNQDNAGNLEWGFDQENNSGPNVVFAGTTWNNALHYYEYHIKANGDPTPWAEWWVDGVQVTGSGSNADGAWTNGGTRWTCTNRVQTQQMAKIAIFETFNPTATNAGQLNISRFSVSSVGRIGP